MIINTVLGNIFQDKQWQDHATDYLELEWHELNKRILRKITTNKTEVGINLVQENITFNDGDIVGVNQDTIIVVTVKPCECIAIKPENNLQLARICYEIGNRHAPLFIDEHDAGVLLLAMDKPLMEMLKKMGAEPSTISARLVKSLNNKAHTSSSHHHH